MGANKSILVNSLRRRDFLLTSLALPGIKDKHPVCVALRVSDGTLLSPSNDEASSWILPPGSTIKPFTLQALLQQGKLRVEETYLCPGRLTVGSHNLTCSHPRGLPPMNAARAIAYSCNCAVSHFAERFTPGELTNALRLAGFRATNANATLQALGEEGVLVSPLELANAYRRLAQHAHPVVVEGLKGAVRYGTAQAAALEKASVAGKTGSANTGTGLRVAWFAGFAPSESPAVVAVAAVQGRSGGSDAAPIGARIFSQYLATAMVRPGQPRETVYRVAVANQILALPAEQYVAAVLAGEASVFRHAESLKAHAVAARTFAAHERGRHATESFDFCNTTHCQRAEPAGVTPRETAAAQATSGEMLRYRGKLAFTPYTMSCGGTAESAGAVWPDHASSYLPVHQDPYCQPATWSRQIALRDVEHALQQAGLQCPPGLSHVSVLDRTASGRARQLTLHGKGTDVVSAGAFRFAIDRAFGWNNVRSDLFDLSGALSIHGRGQGHGVGLCQGGAERMAAQGRTYREILAFYYPGTTTINWLRLGGEGVTVYATDPARDGAVLSQAEDLVRHLPWRLDSAVDIYVYPDLDEFRNTAAEPGWVAARTRECRVDLQPVALLQSHGVLRDTLRHELLHVAVESRAHPDLPVWFREGVVEWLSGQDVKGPGAAVSDEELRQGANRREAQEAHRAAEAQVSNLVARYGKATVLGWISRGLPETVRNSSSSNPLTNNR